MRQLSGRPAVLPGHHIRILGIERSVADFVRVLAGIGAGAEQQLFDLRRAQVRIALL